MNKKLFGIIMLFVSIPLTMFAFNPSNGGEDLYQFASPEILTDGASVAGGALPYACRLRRGTFHRRAYDCASVKAGGIKKLCFFPYIWYNS